MRNVILGVTAATMLVPALSAPAFGKERRGRYSQYYDDDGYHSGPTWRDRQGRERCRRPDGTTGLIVAAAAGAIAGRAIDSRGDRTAGTVVGAVAGALVGREIERSANRCR